jgi:hypothetical protein
MEAKYVAFPSFLEKKHKIFSRRFVGRGIFRPPLSYGADISATWQLLKKNCAP